MFVSPFLIIHTDEAVFACIALLLLLLCSCLLLMQLAALAAACAAESPVKDFLFYVVLSFVIDFLSCSSPFLPVVNCQQHVWQRK